MRVNTGMLLQVRAAAVTAAIAGSLSVASAAFAADSMTEHLAKCDAELQALYGDDVRTRMVKAKTYRGNHTMKFKVFPAGQPSTVIECKSDDNPEQAVKLMSTSGELLNR